jgi:subtilase family serine protease
VYGSLKGNYLYVWPVRGGQVGISYYCDDDSDGYIDSSIDGTCTGNGCVPQGCQTNAGDDCNDNNPAIHPGAIEICNGIDDNCNGQTDEGGVCGSTGADLLVSTWTAPATAVPGSTINITDTTKNQGTGTASASTTKLYWSTNSTWDAGDTYLGARPLPALAAGTTNSGSTTVTVPAGACSGTFYIIAKADADNVVAEGTKETNNTKYKSIKAGPDLIVSTVTAPTTSGAGKTILVTDTTKNQGGCPAVASTTKLYFSNNSTWDAGDTYLGERAVPALAAGATSTGSISVTIPASATTGTRYIIAKADANAVVTETKETNNNKSKSIKIGPDIIVSLITAPTSAVNGSTITVGDTTKNNGGGDAGTSTTRLYLSTNTTYDAGDILLRSRDILSLGAGATSTVSGALTLPSVTPGAYYIIALSDANNAVVETKETNNKKTKAITIKL